MALNNNALAITNYKEAFRLDPFSFEALEKLQTLEAVSDEGSVCFCLEFFLLFLDHKQISKLEFDGFSPGLSSVTKAIYTHKHPEEFPKDIPNELEPLKESSEVLIGQAEFYLSINHYMKAYEITSR